MIWCFIKINVSSLSFIDSNNSLRFLLVLGKNPMKVNFLVSIPEQISADSAAFAPGIGVTFIPSCIASCAKCVPGSAIPEDLHHLLQRYLILLEVLL